MEEHTQTEPGSEASDERRGLLTRVASIGLLGALVAAYGTLAAVIGRFLYPARAARRGFMYVCSIAEVAVGRSFVFRLPNGAPVNITRRENTGEVGDFIALSSTCPHLGCQVHWEGHNNRFFCPCHNGVFDPQGVATGGPPAEAGQSLPQFPLKIEGGLLYIEVPLDQVVRGPGRIEEPSGPPGPGHDPCLYPPSCSLTMPERRA